MSTIERPTRADLQRLAQRRLEARRRGCELVLIGVGERLRLLLAATGLDEVFLIGGASGGVSGGVSGGDGQPEQVPEADG